MKTNRKELETVVFNEGKILVEYGKQSANKGAECHCGKCHKLIAKGEYGYRFTVKSTSLWISEECYKRHEFHPETSTSSVYDATSCKGHTIEIETDNPFVAMFFELEECVVTKGRGANYGKFYARKSAETTLTTSHHVNPALSVGATVKAIVGGKKIICKSLKEFKEATH
jgi:hypothetical protein